eukprot:g3239.t1
MRRRTLASGVYSVDRVASSNRQKRRKGRDAFFASLPRLKRRGKRGGGGGGGGGGGRRRRRGSGADSFPPPRVFRPCDATEADLPRRCANASPPRESPDDDDDDEAFVDALVSELDSVERFRAPDVDDDDDDPELARALVVHVESVERSRQRVVAPRRRLEPENAAPRFDVTSASKSALRLLLAQNRGRSPCCTAASLSKRFRTRGAIVRRRRLADRDVREMFREMVAAGFLEETTRTNAMGYETTYLVPGYRAEALLGGDDGVAVCIPFRGGSVGGRWARPRSGGGSTTTRAVKGQRRLAYGSSGALRIA